MHDDDRYRLRAELDGEVFWADIWINPEGAGFPGLDSDTRAGLDASFDVIRLAASDNQNERQRQAFARGRIELIAPDGRVLNTMEAK